jgi:periplasmic protein TonB
MDPKDKDIANTQQFVVDRLHDIQRKAEAGKFTDALTAIKEVKTADAKNIYVIAIEKQIAKLSDSSLPEENRSGIVKSLPSMIDRAITDIQRRGLAPKVDDSQKDQKEAALEKLKSQYFQRADDYIEKHEYQRALEEIRRIYIIETGSVVAKEYEQKIEQLAALQARNEAEAASAAESKRKKAEVKEQKVEVKKPQKVDLVVEPSKEKVVPQLEGNVKKSKLPIFAAAAAAVSILAIGAWIFFSRSSSSNITQADQQQMQPPSASQDSIVVPTPTTPSTAQAKKGTTSITETSKQPVKTEKKQPATEPTPQAQKPVQTTVTQPVAPSTTTTTRSQATQPAITTPTQPAQQPTTTTQQPTTTVSAPSTPAPMPFVAIENPPEIIRREPAKYPEIAIKAGIQGRVTVEVTIDAQGKPIQTKVVKSSSDVFNDAAVEAIMKYTFKPAMQSTGPVTAKIYIPIDFRLR